MARSTTNPTGEAYAEYLKTLRANLLEMTAEGWRWKTQEDVCPQLMMPRCYTQDTSEIPETPVSPKAKAATFLCVVVPDQAHLEQLPNSIQRENVINASFMDGIRKSGSGASNDLPNEADAKAAEVCAISETQYAVYK